MRITNQFKSQLYNYFVKRLGAFPYKHGWLRVPVCPYCGRAEKMGINLTLYRTNCFRCNEHPNPAQLVMDVEHLDTWSELITFLNSSDFVGLVFKEEKVELAKKVPVYLPEGFKNIKFGDSQLANSIRNYVKHRGFNVDYLSKFGVGYCNEGKLFGYLIIPFYYGQELRYYNARNVMGRGPRYYNPDKSTTGLGKEFIIFNQDALFMYKQVFICEGAINALTMGEKAIATMGKAVSAYQVNQLIKAPCERYILLLDPDAIDKSISLALKLVHYKKVKVVLLPEGCDCNDLGRKTTLKYVWNTRYQSYQELIELRNRFCKDFL